MEKENIGFKPVLKEAQKLGYAEAEPSLDIDGYDTAHKAAILASLAYGKWFGMKPIYIQGIRDISLVDLRFAAELGYRIKLLAIIKQENGDVQIRVHPTLVPQKTLLADIAGVFNGVMVKGNPVGETLFYGRGAGRDATASAVVADLVDVCLNLKFGSHRRVPAFRISSQYRNVLKMTAIMSRYYLRLQVKDQPGVIAKIAEILGGRKISISCFIQKEGQAPDNVTLLILTHQAREKRMLKAIEKIESLPEVKGRAKLIRIEDM
jgi:homoserine dehydrogenase